MKTLESLAHTCERIKKSEERARLLFSRLLVRYAGTLHAFEKTKDLGGVVSFSMPLRPAAPLLLTTGAMFFPDRITLPGSKSDFLAIRGMNARSGEKPFDVYLFSLRASSFSGYAGELQKAIDAHARRRYSFEFTDTFSGQANYSWVKRGEVLAGNDAQAARRIKKELGLSGVRCRREKTPEGFALHPAGQCAVVFINDNPTE